MKLLLLSLLSCLLCTGYAQDTIIIKNGYTAYFSYSLHEPIYVTYQLYHGGGECSRTHMSFKTEGLYHSATAADYAHQGYDKGHLADAEDFAGDCMLEEETFRYYNCVPQTVKLNRGIWKTWETEIRNESQADSLLIICGSIFGSKTMGEHNIAIPDYCWKIVISLTTRQLMHCLLFPNDDSDTVTTISIEELKRKLPYIIEY